MQQKPEIRRPAVSIILPTYNRAKFLPQAFTSIRSQAFTDWELIVVDDGSTDDTEKLVTELTRDWEQPVRYHRQENQGAYGARNTGLGLVAGEYLAFFDSDDVWLPHHLTDCVEALATNPEVDWVFGSCRIIDLLSGRTVAPDTFRPNGQPQRFLELQTRLSGALRIIEDSRVAAYQIRYGLYCGLQNSVIRSRVFADRRFDVRHRNEAEDVLMAFRVLAAGHRFGYLDNVHVNYHTHDTNSSAAGIGSATKLLSVHLAIARGLEDTYQDRQFAPPLRKVLAASLAETYFWKIGYGLLWQNGQHREALAMLRRGLRLVPTNWRYWKTYLGCELRVRTFSRKDHPASTG